MSCTSCIWFNGDPEHEYGWCDTQQEATSKDYHCDFWLGSMRAEPVYGPFCWLSSKYKTTNEMFLQDGLVQYPQLPTEKQYEPSDEGEYE